MRKIIPLIFAVFSSLAMFAQANGGWGNCEFTTVAAMNAFDPSSSNILCKKVYVQANNRHYHWNGTSWVRTESEDNIYTANDTLTTNRVLEGNLNSLTLTGIDTFTISSSTLFNEATGHIRNTADSNSSGTGEHQFYTGGTEQMTLENAGTLDLHQYGTGTYEDNVNNSFDLAVDVSGNVIEVDRRVRKINTTSYSFSTDQNNLTLSNLTTFPYNEVYRINPTENFDLTGITATGVKDGQRLILLNISTDKGFKLKDEDVNSSAANRFILPENADLDVKKSCAITLIYDATSARWRVLSYGKK